MCEACQGKIKKLNDINIENISTIFI